MLGVKGVSHAEIFTRLQEIAPQAALFLVFDACRNGLAGWRGGRGFVPEQRRAGMLIAFSTAPGATASDGADTSGPYAAALAVEMLKPGQNDLLMFHNVRVAVDQRTGGDQVPWIEDGLRRPERVEFAGKGTPITKISSNVLSELQAQLRLISEDQQKLKQLEAELKASSEGARKTVAELEALREQGKRLDAERKAERDRFRQFEDELKRLRAIIGASALTEPSIIREVQEKLYHLNYEIGAPSGRLNDETQKAIRLWQENTKRPVTGEMDAAQLASLRSASIPTSWGSIAYEAKGQTSVAWNRGSRAEAEREVLRQCEDAGRKCRVVTAAVRGCGAVSTYTAVRSGTRHWGTYATVRSTLDEAKLSALALCRESAKAPDECKVGLVMCADGSHQN